MDTLSLQLAQRLFQRHQPVLKRKEKIKIGHGGTLDPLAEGVLPLGVGDGCKALSNYLQGTKEYLVQAQFGAATDTFDSEGTVIHTGPTDHLSRDRIKEVLPLFRGEIDQVPPIYSALRVQGKRLYDYARQGVPVPVPLQARKVTIHRLELVDYNETSQTCVLQVECGGGAYMRSLVHNMGETLGCYAHMNGLKRTKHGPITLNDCVPLVDRDGKVILDLDQVLRVINKMQHP